MPRVLLLTAWGLLVVIVLCLLPVPAAAGGVVGTGLGTCNEAALDAALAGGGLVTFNCGGVPAVIVVSSQKDITQNTTLDGAQRITLSGGDSTRIFLVEANASLTLNNLDLAHGYGTTGAGGGAIFNAGRLSLTTVDLHDNRTTVGGGAIVSFGVTTITHSLLENNRTLGGGGGGAIDNEGSLRLNEVSFTGNVGAGGGGAVVNHFAQLSITGGTYYSNSTTAVATSGGAVYSISGSATISGAVFLSNTTDWYGAAVFNFNGTLTMTDSLVQGNTARLGAGGIDNQGKLFLERVTLIGNTSSDGRGGGLANSPLHQASAVVLNSTLTGNSALDGGGLWTDADLTLINSTVSGNSATRQGGALRAQDGTAQIYNTTLAANQVLVPLIHVDPGQGGGLYITGTAVVEVENSLIALNLIHPALGPLVPEDRFGPLQSLGHNLIETLTNCAVSGNTGGNVVGGNPHLGPLADNGGPTQTQALLFGSPAINAGLSADCAPLDQRGRPRLGPCDIGAFEFALRSFLPLLRR